MFHALENLVMTRVVEEDVTRKEKDTAAREADLRRKHNPPENALRKNLIPEERLRRSFQHRQRCSSLVPAKFVLDLDTMRGRVRTRTIMHLWLIMRHSEFQLCRYPVRPHAKVRRLVLPLASDVSTRVLLIT